MYTHRAFFKELFIKCSVNQLLFVSLELSGQHSEMTSLSLVQPELIYKKILSQHNCDKLWLLKNPCLDLLIVVEAQKYELADYKSHRDIKTHACPAWL